MQPRLTRSRTESIIAGVCGGLGEYFGVDPVIVRLIFVLITLTTGVGVIIYPVLWIVMPKAPEPAQAPGAPANYVLERKEAQQSAYVRHEAAMYEPAGRAGSGPIPPSKYNFDPITGQPIAREPAATGQTVNLDDPMQHPITASGQPGYGPAPSPARRWRWLGFTLLAIGILALSDALGINTDFVFPIIMIGIGVLLLRRR
jgi:phage shock protein C